MIDYQIDNLIKIGKAHSLHCEDDYLIEENECFILCAVFDGCSSGKDSHYASTKHKYLLRESFESFGQCLFYKEEPLHSNILWILEMFRSLLSKEKYKCNEEMLSTIVLLLINKKTEEYGIMFCGDGVCSINGENKSVHDDNGNAVWYISTAKDENIDDYYYDYCNYVNGKIIDGMEISISSDGVESFMTKYGSCNKEYPQDIFFNTKNSLPIKYHNWNLERLYNVLIKGKLPGMENEGLSNIDDLTIIKVKINKNRTDETT